MTLCRDEEPQRALEASAREEGAGKQEIVLR